jgi:hypothetical protein
MIKRALKKPLKEGRYWWKEPESSNRKLVYVEQQSLGLYVLGAGWLPWQTGEWSGLVGEQSQPKNLEKD